MRPCFGLHPRKAAALRAASSVGEHCADGSRNVAAGRRKVRICPPVCAIIPVYLKKSVRLRTFLPN